MYRTVGEELFSVHPDHADGGRSAYRFRRAKDVSGLAESWFRDSILANPELVLGPCRAAGLVEQDEDWYSWAKEVTVGTIGAIDVLLVSRLGRVGIVETKLFFNPEARRTVLAQALDYAIHLPEIKLDNLPIVPSEVGVAREDIEEHLATGDFLLIVAGDDLDPRAVRLSEALLGEHLANPWDLAMVDVSLYEATEQPESGFLAVSALRSALVAKARNVLRVDVGQDGRPTVRIERIPPQAERRKCLWTLERLREEYPILASRNPSLGGRLLSMLEWAVGANLFLETTTYEDRPAFLLHGPVGGMMVSFYSDGNVHCQVGRSAASSLGSEKRDAYVAELKGLGLLATSLDVSKVEYGRNLTFKIDKMTEEQLRGLRGVFEKYLKI